MTGKGRSAPKGVLRAVIVALLVALFSGCERPESNVERGNRLGILHKGNGKEVQDLDPHVVNSVSAFNIMMALLEGLVTEDPVDLHPVPGVAERWDISPDARVYTFHLRENARWSNGDPVTAKDFMDSYRRILSPKLASDYAYMLFPVVNAEAFHKGELTDFSQVGFAAPDPRTFIVTLRNPTPYFLSLLCHYSWYPVHLPTIEKHGPGFARGSRWTRPGRYVGNGPFTLTEWRLNSRVRVEKNPHYWDRETVSLNGIVFHTIESNDVEERAFRTGQIHLTDTVPVNRIERYRRQAPHLLRFDPYLGTYFYGVNVGRPTLNNRLVRRALAMAIDRQAIVERIWRGGQLPAHHFTPANTAGYTSEATIPTDIPQAQRLLSEAGYPGGRGLPPIQILFNSSENHKLTAEAIQQMWRANLGVMAELVNQEEKVYFDSRRQRRFDIVRWTWIGDYNDPKTFLDMWVTGGGNNHTGWSNPEYDRLIAATESAIDQAARYDAFRRAEALLLDEAPVLPIFFFTRALLIHPSVKNWHPTILDHHPYKYVRLQ